MATTSPEITALLDALNKLTGAQSQSVRDTYIYSEAIRKAGNELDDLTENFRKQNSQNKDIQRAQNQLLKAKRDEKNLLEQLIIQQREQGKLAKKLAEVRKTGTQIEQAEVKKQSETNRANAADTIANLRSARAEQKRSTAELLRFGGSLGGGISKLNIFFTVLSWFASQLIGANKVFMDATTKSAGVIEKTTDSFDGSMGSWMSTITWATGIETARALEIMASNRQIVNSLGGMDNAIELTKDSVRSMRGFYSSLEESLKENMGILTQFGQKGVKPTNQTILAYNTDLKQLAKQTGLAATSINALINSVADDTDSLYILKEARIGEREAILANQRALLKSNIALGMTAEQAAEAGKMLSKMVAQRPLERLKQAAKIRALGAAMGMGSEANRAADILTKGSRASPAERTELNNLNVRMTEVMDTAAQGGMAQELFATTLLDKLDLNQYYGGTSPFSDTLGNQLKMSQEAVAAMYQSSSESVVVKLNVQIERLQAIFEAVMKGTIFGGLILQALEYISGPIKAISDTIGHTTNLLGKITGLWDSDFSNTKPVNEQDTRNQIEQDTLTAEYRRKAKEDYDRIKQLEIESAKNVGVEKDKYEKQIAFIRDKQSDDAFNYENQLEKLRAENNNVARVKSAEENTTVKIASNPVEQAAEKAQTSRVEGYASDQVSLITTQNSKIDEQLKQMGFSNDFLKIISDNTSSLIDIADKQLAVATMNEKQKSQFAATFGNQNSRFNADYAIGAAVS